MYERSITIGSVGKSLSVTGWRCGWALTGNVKIRNALARAHQLCVYASTTIVQESVARSLEIEYENLTSHKSTYWTQLSAILLKKRDFMASTLSSVGLNPIIPDGGYFLTVDCKDWINKLDLDEFYDKRGKGISFVKWLSKNGLQVVPMDIFYSEDYKYLGENYVRICFFKSDETLAEAKKVLLNLKSKYFGFELNTRFSP